VEYLRPWFSSLGYLQDVPAGSFPCFSTEGIVVENKRSIRARPTALVGLLLLVSAGTTLGQSLDQPDEFAQMAPIDAQELAAERGRDGDSMVIVQSNQKLSATITDTAFTANQINSGPVQLENGALKDFNGVGLFNFVTGNGNAIDAAIGVNIYLQ
jgi:hypothetical protein